MSANGFRTSNLPRAMTNRETAKLPTNSVCPNYDCANTTANNMKESKRASLMTNLNKELPSPPIVQVVDPNSPPKAQRTLVDAESGILSDSAWPILQPENVSCAEIPLITNEKAYVQEQQRIMSHRSAFVHVANKLVENRNDRSSSAFEDRIERCVSPTFDQAASSQNGRTTQNAELRRLSSNNPYAKEFHAVSPGADVAVSSPIAHKSTTPTLLAVPPRISSKRSSLPLSGLGPAHLPVRSTSSCSHGDKLDSRAWTRPKQDTEKALGTESDNARISESPPTSTSTTTRVEARRSPSPVQSDLLSASIKQSAHHQDSLVISESTLFFGKQWTSEPITGWWSKQMAYGPTLHIHEHSDAIIYGDPSQMPPDLPAPAPGHERSSFGSSMGTLALQTRSSLTFGVGSSEDLPIPTRKLSIATSPTAISPIRAMRPTRQRSTTASHRNFSTPTRQPPPPPRTDDGIAPVKTTTEPIADLDLEDDDEIGFAQALNELSPGPAAADNARKGALAKKSRTVLGVRIKSPLQPPRNTGGFMAQTASSAGKVSGRKSSSEEKKGTTIKLKAKRSFHNLFAKNEAASTARTPTPSEPKRSIANSGKTLAKRISKNFSKVQTAEVPANELQNLEALTKRQSALTSVAAVSSSMASPEPLTFFPVETAATVNHIIANVSAMKTKTPEGMRSLEIAETVVLVAELAKKNQISGEKARLCHVRQHLDSLLHFEFKDEVLQGLMDGLKGSRIVSEIAKQGPV
jgi:hypothetical protein